MAKNVPTSSYAQNFRYNKIVIIIQAPNLSLWIWMLTKIISLFTKGVIHQASATISTVAIIIWAYLELTKGVNWFRKTLGFIVLVLTTYSLFNQLK